MAAVTQNVPFSRNVDIAGEIGAVSIPGGSIDIIDDFRNVEAVFNSDVFSFDYEYHIAAQLTAMFGGPDMGAALIDYPIVTTLDIPCIEAGEAFEIGTSPEVDVEAGIDADSLSYGDANLVARLSSNGASVSNMRITDPTGAVAIQVDDVFSIPGFDVSSPLITADTGGDVGGGGPISLILNLLAGAQASDSASGTVDASALPTLEANLAESILEVEADVASLLSLFPALRAASLGNREFTVDMGPVEASVGYELFKPFISAGYQLVQTATFIPGPIETTIEIFDQSFSGSLGDVFEFQAPDDFSGSAEGRASYDLGGRLDVSYELQPFGRVGYEALTLEVDFGSGDPDSPPVFGTGSGFSVGPVASGEIDTANSDGVITLLSQSVDLNFETIEKTFEVEECPPGEDVALVIDVSGSMEDDIAEVKASARRIVDAVFGADGALRDSRLAIVIFNDVGDYRTVLNFTDQDDIAARKSAALSAISSISISDGGLEPLNAALLSALNGEAGGWRENAIARRAVVFSDEPPGDPELRPQVVQAAGNVSVDLAPRSRPRRLC